MGSLVMQLELEDPAMIDSISAGKLDDAAKQISVSLTQEVPKEAAIGIETILVTVVVSFAASLPASILANWLYDRFKSRASGMRIDGERVEIEVTSITKRIRVHFESDDTSRGNDRKTTQ
jgi:hypothetical protein